MIPAIPAIVVTGVKIGGAIYSGLKLLDIAKDNAKANGYRRGYEEGYQNGEMKAQTELNKQKLNGR